jgi:hypothetical protein
MILGRYLETPASIRAFCDISLDLKYYSMQIKLHLFIARAQSFERLKFSNSPPQYGELPRISSRVRRAADLVSWRTHLGPCANRQLSPVESQQRQSIR